MRQKRLYRTTPIWVRLMAQRRVEPNGCWTHTTRPDGNGYCSVAFYGKRIKTHRWVYERVIGPIPEGYEVDHLCKNRRCFNPEHLEAVTPRENNLRSESPSAKRARQTHCQQGHPLAGQNLILERDGRSRRCRTCTRAYERRRRAEKP